MASASLYVRPAEGRLVRMPDRPYPYLPVEPQNVPDTTYWRRRLADGDIVLAEPEGAAKPKKAKEG